MPRKLVKKKSKKTSQVLKEVRQPKYHQRIEKDKKKEIKNNPPWEE